MAAAGASSAETDSSTALPGTAMGWLRFFNGEDAGIRSRFSSAADGDRVDISTHSVLMFEKSDFTHFPDTKLGFQWGHTFSTPPGTHVC